MLKKIILIGLIGLISGCSSYQSTNKDNFDITKNKYLKNEINKMDSNKKSYEEIKIKPVNILRTTKLPNKKITFEFSSESTIQDLMNVFKYYKINTILDSRINLKSPLNINRFDGYLVDLLNAISEENNLSFEYENNFLRIEKEKSYTLKIIQNDDIVENIYKELEKNKTKDLIKTDNTISFKSDYNKYKKIRSVINSINNNTSLINLDITIIKVDLNEENNTGFDWSTLNIASNIKPEKIIKSGFNLLSGNKLGIVNENINISLVMKLLNKYGETKAIQNTSIKTISGKKAILKTVQKTPFLSDIQTSSNGEYLKTGYTTKEIETGLEIEILPFFDKDTKMVNSSILIKQSNLKEFFTVSSSDIEIKQPKTEEQTFNSMIRLKAGESSVIGGLIYEEEKQNGNNINALSKITNYNNNKKQKKALFIIVKPSVKTYV